MLNYKAFCLSVVSLSLLLACANARGAPERGFQTFDEDLFQLELSGRDEEVSPETRHYIKNVQSNKIESNVNVWGGESSIKNNSLHPNEALDAIIANKTSFLTSSVIEDGVKYNAVPWMWSEGGCRVRWQDGPCNFNQTFSLPVGLDYCRHTVFWKDGGPGTRGFFPLEEYGTKNGLVLRFRVISGTYGNQYSADGWFSAIEIYGISSNAPNTVRQQLGCRVL